MMGSLVVRLKWGALRSWALRTLGGVVLLMSAGAGFGQTNFYTLATNGPSSNRISIVFLAEGYTTSQTNSFLGHCTNAMNALTGFEPFQEYRSFFNFYALFVPSAESGSDRGGVFKNTFFNSVYEVDNGSAGFITIPSGSTGQGKVDALMTGYFPTNQFRFRLPVMIVNEPANGGSGGPTCIVAAWTELDAFLRHEIAHSLAGLGDEYDNAVVTDSFTFGEEPNTTQQTNRALVKWNAWISTNTPVPTPNDFAYAAEVGLFEGAHYSPTNWYRPKFECLMRYVLSGMNYCEVCREHLVKTFHSKVRAIESASPANPAVTLTNSQMTVFSVTPLNPLTHALSVQWQTNGVNIASATNTTFNFNPATVTNGAYTLRAIVRDNTDWVRNDPGQSLFSTNSWSVTVAIPQLWLESPQALTNGKFRFTVRGSAVANFTIQASTNLTTWPSLSTNALVGGQFHFTNSPTSLPWRFYRAVAPPQ